MNIYTLTESNKYKTLVDEGHAGGLQEYASRLAFNRAPLPIGEFIGSVVYNSEDVKKSPIRIFTHFSSLF